VVEKRNPQHALFAATLMIAALLSLGLTRSWAVELPSSGRQLQQVPPAPQPPPVTPEIRIERPDAPAAASDTTNATIVVNGIRITNARQFSEAELLAATQFKPGESLTLTQLRDIASQIVSYYHLHGYFLAQAMLPPQDVKDGIVMIAVLEGQYGNVVVRNHSRLSDRVANSLVDDLNSGDAIDIASLESGLLLLSDLPGVEVKSTLTPGASVGAADLIIDVTSGRTFDGIIEADNFGNRYSGEYRIGGSANLNNPFGWGDVASLRILSSADGFNYGRAAYQLQIERTTLGAAYTALGYELGEEFESLQAHGTAKIAGVYASHPILRRRHANLSVVANLESKQFRDEMDIVAPPIVTRKKTQVAMMSLNGNRKSRGERFGGSASNFSLTWTTGTLELLDTQANNTGAGTAAEGHYDKVTLAAAYLKFLPLEVGGSSLSVYFAVQGQWAADNLDVSEKMSLGGPNSVRAFPEGEATVDEGYVVTAEARLPLPIKAIPGRWEIAAFGDFGAGNLSVDPVAGQEYRRTLGGAGLGLNWSVGRSFYLRANYARKLGSDVATSVPDSDSRFWINAVVFL